MAVLASSRQHLTRCVSSGGKRTFDL